MWTNEKKNKEKKIANASTVRTSGRRGGREKSIKSKAGIIGTHPPNIKENKIEKVAEGDQPCTSKKSLIWSDWLIVRASEAMQGVEIPGNRSLWYSLHTVQRRRSDLSWQTNEKETMWVCRYEGKQWKKKKTREGVVGALTNKECIGEVMSFFGFVEIKKEYLYETIKLILPLKAKEKLRWMNLRRMEK